MAEINLTFKNNKARLVLAPNADLTELSFALETAISNFLGRGIYTFNVIRTKLEDKSCVVEFTALCNIGLMRMSKVASIGSMVQERLLPERLSVDFREIEAVKEGQNQHGKINVNGDTVTVIEGIALDPKMQVSTISYGLADLLTGLFNLNINFVKWQGSLRKTQCFIRHNLEEKELIKFLSTHGNDYPLRKTVNELT